MKVASVREPPEARATCTGWELTGSPSPIEATFTEPARYMAWPLPSLRRFMDNRPDLRITLQGLVNRDLAGKLERLLPQ